MSQAAGMNDWLYIQCLYWILNLVNVRSPYREVYGEGYEASQALNKGPQIPGGRQAATTKFCIQTLNICRFSVWNLLQVALVTPKIYGWLVYFYKKKKIAYLAVLTKKKYVNFKHYN